MISRVPTNQSFAMGAEALKRDCVIGWLQWPIPRRDEVRLFCFHPAGVDAPVYRQRDLGPPSSMRVAAIQLPSRANRIAEAPIADIPSLIGELVSNLAPTIFGGDNDRQIPVEELEPWAQETNAGCDVHVFSGEHFYLDFCGMVCSRRW